MTTETQVMELLKGIVEPNSGMNLADLGMIDEVEVRDGNVKVKLGINFDLYVSPSAIYVINSIKKKVHSFPDVNQVDVKLLSDKWAEQMV